MYNHDGTTDFLKMLSIFVFIGVGVWWLQGAIGQDYTVLVIFALVGVILFAAGALFAHMNQQSTLSAITKFNANDAQIDKYRMMTMKETAKGDAAMQRAAAQMQLLDAKRVDKIAQQRANLLVADTKNQDDTWSWDEEDVNSDASFQVWE